MTFAMSGATGSTRSRLAATSGFLRRERERYIRAAFATIRRLLAGDARADDTQQDGALKFLQARKQAGNL
jgi:hypothetical protein